MTRRQAYLLALLVPFAPLALAIGADALSRKRKPADGTR